MAGALIHLTELPKMGFAHHFYTENYSESRYGHQKGIEIVYVKEGAITAELYGKTYEILPGSCFVLLRHLPYRLYGQPGAVHTHCSVQLMVDYTYQPFEDTDVLPEDFDGLVLPVIVPPCRETELIRKELYALISDAGMPDENRQFASSLAMCGILSKLDAFYRQQLHSERSTSSFWEYRIKRYVAEHIHHPILLEDLATALEKTPNYLNRVFRESTGISIHQYINREKMQRVAELLSNKDISFATACESVAIPDVSHGYRLFKKHMGVTPGTYLAGKRLKT